jgi:hypothetical protein
MSVQSMLYSDVDAFLIALNVGLDAQSGCSLQAKPWQWRWDGLLRLRNARFCVRARFVARDRDSRIQQDSF